MQPLEVVQPLSKVSAHTKKPETIPEQPNPEIARPRTSTRELGAVADTAIPASTMHRAHKNKTLIENTVYNLPYKNCEAQVANRLRRVRDANA